MTWTDRAVLIGMFDGLYEELRAIDTALGYPDGFTSAAGQTRADLITAIRRSADTLQAEVTPLQAEAQRLSAELYVWQHSSR